MQSTTLYTWYDKALYYTKKAPSLLIFVNWDVCWGSELHKNPSHLWGPSESDIVLVCIYIKQNHTRTEVGAPSSDVATGINTQHVDEQQHVPFLTWGRPPILTCLQDTCTWNVLILDLITSMETWLYIFHKRNLDSPILSPVARTSFWICCLYSLKLNFLYLPGLILLSITAS